MQAAPVSSNPLLVVKARRLFKVSTLLPIASNTLISMGGKKSAAAVLASNLRGLMADDRTRTLSSSPKVAARSGVAQRTVNNMEKARHDPHLSSIEAIARAFSLEPYQLLCPQDEKEFFQLVRAWHAGTPQERELLLAAAETVTRRHAAKAPASDSGQR